MKNKVTINDVLARYDLKKEDVSIVFNAVVSKAKEIGVEVIITDLSHVKEVEVFRDSLGIEPKDDHYETCVTDGKTVYMHNRDEKTGGVAGQLYDVLHVALGHLWQWGSDQKGGLQFFGNFAFELGTIFYLGANEKQLDIVREYEREGSVIAFTNLLKILESLDLPHATKVSIKHFVSDYMHTDLWYIIDYYRNGIEKPFYECWKYNQPMISEINLPAELNLVKRNAPAIPLISNR